VKCGRNDAVNELGTVHVLVVTCRLSDWLNKTESNRCPRIRSNPESFASFIKTIPAFEPISDWRNKKSPQIMKFEKQGICLSFINYKNLQALFEGGVNQGLLPMTINDEEHEESNLFCACHLLKCYEGQGQ
jgi:hypothetical protein